MTRDGAVPEGLSVADFMREIQDRFRTKPWLRLQATSAGLLIVAGAIREGPLTAFLIVVIVVVPLAPVTYLMWRRKMREQRSAVADDPGVRH